MKSACTSLIQYQPRYYKNMNARQKINESLLNVSAYVKGQILNIHNDPMVTCFVNLPS